MAPHEPKHEKQAKKEASFVLQAGCIVGLVVYGWTSAEASREPSVYIIIALAAGFIGVKGLERIIDAVGRIIGRK